MKRKVRPMIRTTIVHLNANGTRSQRTVNILADHDAVRADQIYVGGTETAYTYDGQHDDDHTIYWNTLFNGRVVIANTEITRLETKLRRRARKQQRADAAAVPHGVAAVDHVAQKLHGS